MTSGYREVANSPIRILFAKHARRLRRLRTGLSSIAMIAGGLGLANSASAQVAPTPNLVSVCSGVSLPPSVVTNILRPVINGVVTPVQDTVNPILGTVGALLPLVPPLNIDANGLLTTAASGAPVTLQVLNANGTVVGPADRCDSQADSYTLTTPKGISLGGNRITGLGATGQEANAAEINSIALGNLASTDATAARSVAIGPNATVGPNAAGSIALGSNATATVANSLALGAGSVANRGPLTGYAALGLAGLQNSAGEVSIGSAGALRQLTNLAAGTAASDAATVGQLTGVAAQIGTLANGAVLYDTATHDLVTLGGANGTTITNVRAGALTPTSTDAVNGAQLAATNAAVAANTTNIAGNTTAITNLGNTVTNLTNTVSGLGNSVTNLGTTVTNLTATIANGGIGPVQYSNPNTPTIPNGGVPTNDLTLVGATPGAVGLHNVAAGAIGAGSTDAVNGGQVYQLSQSVANAVTYDTDAGGNRTNTITLAGGNAAAPVTITNVAAGTLAAGSTEAVNGGQLYATNQAVAAVATTANTALTLSQNSVQYDSTHTSVTLNPGGTAVTIHNVAAGTGPTDAVNVTQLNTSMNTAITTANTYTDSRIAAISYDLRGARRAANAGTSSAMAAAGLPQAYEAGKGMIALGGGVYGDTSAVAVGFSKAFNDGHTVMKMGASHDSNGMFGASGGVGYQF